ncbi:dTDP-4-dehydrorhamnose 3,5-epimerase [Chitinispirillum alkaliphilum]|nr:dTDP-4-dehydrorhamnose 3,5-epimerase [Chitinispirillum alkaliphilum]
MEFIKTDFDDVYVIKPKVFNDERGFFLETYSYEKFQHAGITDQFIQDNHSKSVSKGVIRGLHFQAPPYAQSKLIRVTKGAIYDVIVDLRPSSKTLGRWRGFELSEENFLMLYIPAGFAHGFCTTRENCEVQYKVDKLYAPGSEGGIRWDDPDLAIDWPSAAPQLSAKDATLPYFKDFTNPFST